MSDTKLFQELNNLEAGKFRRTIEGVNKWKEAHNQELVRIEYVKSISMYVVEGEVKKEVDGVKEYKYITTKQFSDEDDAVEYLVTYVKGDKLVKGHDAFEPLSERNCSTM